MLGIDPTKLGGRRQLRTIETDPVPIWPDMADGWALFLAMGTQWNWVAGGFGAFQSGLKYEAVEVVARSLGMKLDDGRIPVPVFLDLRTLEAETLRCWSARRK